MNRTCLIAAWIVAGCGNDETTVGDSGGRDANDAPADDGTGDHRSITTASGVTGIRIETTDVFAGARKVSFDYQEAGDYSRLLETVAIDHNEGGGPPVVARSSSF